MIHDNWRSTLAAFALMTLSACGVAAPPGDASIADESETDLPSAAAAAASEDDGHDVGSTESRPSVAPTLSPMPAAKSLPDDAKGPHPEPWSAKPD